MSLDMEEIKARAEETVNEIAEELKELSLKIHDNPELGHEEVQACRWQMEILTKYGFEAEKNFCGIPTAYRAVYRGKKPGPKLAMLAEYDALPELGPGCGHNLIAMVSVGSGLAIRPFVDEFGGEIQVIGTPAEETAGAKVEMARQGAFDDFDAVMMGHPADTDAESVDTMALVSLKFEFFGRPAHAAGAPETGLNALDAVVSFYQMVSVLRQQTKPDARIHGIITKGGSAVNVIPDYTEAVYNIRSNRVADAWPLAERVKACAEAAALGTGTKVKISPVDEDFMDTYSNRALSDLACEQMELLGHKMMHFGRIVMPGSSDLGDVSYHCPAIQLGMNMGPSEDGKPYGAHTVEFARQACSQTALNRCLDFVKGFAMTAAKLLAEPEHLEKIRKEFDEEVRPQIENK